MSFETIDALTSRKPLRLWPGVVLAVLLLLVRFGLPVVWPDGAIFGVLGAVVSGLLIVLWWLFLSRAPWSERIGALVLMVAGGLATPYILHESITDGMMGRMFPIYLAVPFLGLALVVWAVATRNIGWKPRRAALVATLLIACGAFALVRTDGVTGEGIAQMKWRWTPTAEERLLANAPPDPPAPAAVEIPKGPAVAAPSAAPDKIETPSDASSTAKRAAAAPEVSALESKESGKRTSAFGRAEWPGFRGPHRDGIVHGPPIETDWRKKPPAQLWRRQVGPGWSSFAVRGDVIYTQEQRGNDELVSAYRLNTGQPVWTHRDPVRFWESNAGAGPRGTPTLHGDRIYTFGGTGVVNALDARTGAVIWSRNASKDTGVEVPEWGFASSPLVVDDLVVIAAAGQLIGYEVANGELRWRGPEGGAGYSSPHYTTIDGVPQILLLRGSRTISVSPADGKLLWEHVWQTGVGIIQPSFVADRDVLLSAGDAMGGVGLRRIAVTHGPAEWKVEERWTSRGLKPYFNDFVVHKGHAYGFDGSILACIDVNDGQRKWKGGRYGSGQLVLLSEQDLLLVLSEEGELALVKAAPDQFMEVARSKGIEGKTWNHPVLVGDVLLVRNDQEMAAFRLSLAR
jgi:outer membrane protein assembly factor BamB